MQKKLWNLNRQIGKASTELTDCIIVFLIELFSKTVLLQCRQQYQGGNITIITDFLFCPTPAPPLPPPSSGLCSLTVVNAQPLMAMASSPTSLKNVCLPPPSPYLFNNETTQGCVSIHNGAAVEPSRWHTNHERLRQYSRKDLIER